MSGILDGINKRTQLVGKNRLELLMFRLGDGGLYGINVFKVREVIRCPELTSVHSSHPVVIGITNVRGKTISIMDLSLGIVGPSINDPDNSFIIITEFNRSVQGFMVEGVERIVNMNWEDINLPPEGAKTNSYINAVTRVDEELVQLIDVEQVLSEVVGMPEMVSSSLTETVDIEHEQVRHILVADDSIVATNQIVTAMEQIQVDYTVVNNGKLAIDLLRKWADSGRPIEERIAMVLSDIEMPEMDGYTLTSEIRRDPRLKDLHVILHSSLSGIFNENMVKKVGANAFVPKFSADDLVKQVLPIIQNSGKVAATAAEANKAA